MDGEDVVSGSKGRGVIGERVGSGFGVSTGEGEVDGDSVEKFKLSSDDEELLLSTLPSLSLERALIIRIMSSLIHDLRKLANPLECSARYSYVMFMSRHG